MTDRYETVVLHLADEIGRLGPRAQTAFFAACGEALLPLFHSFHEETGWGDPEVLSQALDTAWRFVCEGRLETRPELIEALASAVPHGDDFDSPQSTFAQDAVICVDAAVKPAVGMQVDGSWVEYVLEPMATSLTLRDLGLTDVGSDSAGDAVRDGLVDDPAMAQALAFCRTALATLHQGQFDDCMSVIATLRTDAAVLRPVG